MWRDLNLFRYGRRESFSLFHKRPYLDRFKSRHMPCKGIGKLANPSKLANSLVQSIRIREFGLTPRLLKVMRQAGLSL